jgi:uroporphyrin-III C-methyltransferase/precorrin-2 dehydrogenase/sirohydrochlorin ferrochelatase
MQFLTTQVDNRRADADPLFPIFLRLAGRRVLLVGGGKVAAAKLAALRAADALVTVVAPAIDPAMRQPGVTVQERGFLTPDLDDAWLVVAAATPEVNRQVQAAAESRRVFVNAVDDPPSATAYAGAVVRRGAVTVAVSTGGEAPALAGLLREGLEAVLPEDLDSWLATARSLRVGWRADGVPISARRPLLLEALNRIYQQPPPEGAR